ncbi:MAG: NAD(P)-dependent oxidoreductase [bacterium]|nr:NAD(P)-dependent oxidoreductase [bacterium]
MNVGFAGIGLMGEPMARNLLRAGTPLVVWNRTPEKCAALAAEGARVAATSADLFAGAPLVILMLSDERAMDDVLGRRTPDFAQRVTGHTIVSMGTTAPAYSRALGAEIASAGGSYVEAPVSGSRGPAERGELVVMLAGEPHDIERVELLLSPIARATYRCGSVPNALTMKLSINHYMIAMIAGLVEAVHGAYAAGVPLDTFAAIVNDGQMSNTLARAKLEKLIARDFSAHAAIDDVAKNTRFISDMTRQAGVPSPLLDICNELVHDASARGYGSLDMTALLQAYQDHPGAADTRFAKQRCSGERS